MCLTVPRQHAQFVCWWALDHNLGDLALRLLVASKPNRRLRAWQQKKNRRNAFYFDIQKIKKWYLFARQQCGHRSEGHGSDQRPKQVTNKHIKLGLLIDFCHFARCGLLLSCHTVKKGYLSIKDLRLKPDIFQGQKTLISGRRLNKTDKGGKNRWEKGEGWIIDRHNYKLGLFPGSALLLLPNFHSIYLPCFSGKLWSVEEQGKKITPLPAFSHPFSRPNIRNWIFF